MNLFNPRILDASIRDVTVNLTDTQKADVLLHALQHLPIQGYVQSNRLSLKSLHTWTKLSYDHGNCCPVTLASSQLFPCQRGTRALAARQRKARCGLSHVRSARYVPLQTAHGPIRHLRHVYRPSLRNDSGSGKPGRQGNHSITTPPP